MRPTSKPFVTGDESLFFAKRAFGGLDSSHDVHGQQLGICPDRARGRCRPVHAGGNFDVLCRLNLVTSGPWKSPEEAGMGVRYFSGTAKEELL